MPDAPFVVMATIHGPSGWYDVTATATGKAIAVCPKRCDASRIARLLSRPTTSPAPSKPAASPRKAVKAKVETEPGPSPSRLVKATYNVPEALVEETRNAVLFLSGPPLRLTLSALVESALRRELERLRKAHNGGEPFDGPGKALKGGRPLK